MAASIQLLSENRLFYVLRDSWTGTIEVRYGNPYQVMNGSIWSVPGTLDVSA